MHENVKVAVAGLKSKPDRAREALSKLETAHGLTLRELATAEAALEKNAMEIERLLERIEDEKKKNGDLTLEVSTS